MPVVQVDAGDKLAVTLTMPEASEGDEIYLEAPNGGSFPGDTKVGRVLKTGSDRRVSFEFIADTSRGNCTIHIRQDGHTRTLPLWIGQLENPAPETES